MLFTAFVWSSVMLAIENNWLYNQMRTELEAREDPTYIWNLGVLEDLNLAIYRYDHMMYFMMVSMFTVGYGDISPQNEFLGRYLIIIIVV